MNYQTLGNYRVRENGQKKKSIFLKVEEIRRDIMSIIPEIDSSKLLMMLSHCRNHYNGKLVYGRRNSPNNRPRELTKNEYILYGLFKKICG